VSLGKPGPGGLEVFAMFPSKLTIPAGTTVKFMMSSHTRETHTATFGPTDYRNGLVSSVTSPIPSPAAVYPSDPPGQTPVVPTEHGGFANTGALDRDRSTPLPAFGAIKFTTPGTYSYQCLIHSFMHGTITVTS
jgi:plastocyanin